MVKIVINLISIFFNFHNVNECLIYLLSIANKKIVYSRREYPGKWFNVMKNDKNSCPNVKKKVYEAI